MPAIKFFGQLAGNTPLYPAPSPSRRCLRTSSGAPTFGRWARAPSPPRASSRCSHFAHHHLRFAFRPERCPRARRRQIRGRQPHRRDMPMRSGDRGLHRHHRDAVGFAHLPPHEGRGHVLVSESFCRRFRGRFRISVCHRRRPHQRTLGNSSNPISGMSIATLMATCAIFFLPAGPRQTTPPSRS